VCDFRALLRIPSGIAETAATSLAIAAIAHPWLSGAEPAGFLATRSIGVALLLRKIKLRAALKAHLVTAASGSPVWKSAKPEPQQSVDLRFETPIS